MIQKRNCWTWISIIGLLILILDSKTVMQSALDGIHICLKVIIPSLFPYFVLCNLLTATLSGRWASLALGFLGGYPAGAQAIKNAYDYGHLSKSQAESRLAYCNNAGPAFIFGMLSQLFTERYIPWVIWSIHILSALFVSWIFCDTSKESIATKEHNDINLTASIERAVKAISLVSSWVLLFRIIVNIAENRLFGSLSRIHKTIITGILELTNGCNGLFDVESVKLRFILSSGFIGFGGICVMLQTTAVTKELKLKKYYIGKLMQTGFSIVLSLIASKLIF